MTSWLRPLVITVVAAITPGREGFARAASPKQAATRSDVADYYVSPQGRDNWSGRLADPAGGDGPFATVRRAREAVRDLRQSQKAPRTIRVVLRGGTYYLDWPLEFGPEDSGAEHAPIIYAAAANEKVVISGGHRLPAGRWDRANGHRVWRVELPEVKTGRWNFRQLFANGERRTRARLPARGEYRIEALPEYDPMAGENAFLNGTTQFITARTNLQTWRNLPDVEVVGITRWIDNHLQIAGVDLERGAIRLDRTSLFALVEMSGRPSVYWMENVFEALDAPGEWYLDRPNGVFYYLPLPKEEMSSAQLIAPRLPQIIRVVGRAGAPVHDLEFEGIVFAHTEWEPPADWASSLQAAVDVPGALFFDYAERCRVTQATIEHVGTYGVEVGVGCQDLEFSHNRLRDLGAGGVKVGHFFSYEPNERGRRREAAMPRGQHSRRITVTDNQIAQGGRIFAAGVGVFIGDNAENRITHNHIFDFFYTGISVGSVQDFGPCQATGNVIEYNHVHDLGQGMLSDLAGIYTCSSPNSRIAYNVIHDVGRREYGGWGIYPDEGSHDLLIQKNLVYRCQDGALFAHHNHNVTAENNIFAFNRGAQIERGGLGGFELTCRRNLLEFMEGTAVGDYGGANWGPAVCAFDDNLYWNASGGPVRFARMTFSDWQKAGQDTNSLVADPQFADPERGDFTLRSGSPARQIGFEPWDFSGGGPRPLSRPPN
jgi:hypothetical protein